MDGVAGFNSEYFQPKSEKTLVDKYLGKQDIEAIRLLIRKDNLTRQDFRELLYLLSSSEAKLLNYGAYERYIILKFFIWIREFVKMTEQLYDYREDLDKKAKIDPTFVISWRTRKLLDNNKRLAEHNVKFLIDLYFNIGRTSLSLDAVGFRELLSSKYEVSYKGLGSEPQMMQQPKGFLGFGRR